MKNIKIFLFSVFVVFLFSSCNKVDNPISSGENQMQTDGPQTEFTQSMTVSEDDGDVSTIIADESIVRIGYGLGEWISFYTNDYANRTYNAAYSLSWYGGTSSNDAGLFQIKNSSGNIIFEKNLHSTTAYSGSAYGSFGLEYLYPGELYYLRLSTVLYTGGDEDE